ncbi:unnamed protein product [Caenorhabditis nigoni]
MFQTTSNSSKFEYSWLDVKNFNEHEEIFNIWGPAFQYGFSFHWYFRMKNSEENVLRIEFHERYEQFFFDKIEMREVPDEAIVHDYNEN